MRSVLNILIVFLGHFCSAEGTENRLDSDSIVNNDTLMVALEKQITTWDKIDDDFHLIRKLIEAIPDSSTRDFKPLLDRILFYYYALDSSYSNSDKLYKIKYHLQDSIESLANAKLNKYKVVGIKAAVYIKNTQDLVRNDRTTPQFEYLLYVNLFHDYEKYRRAKNQDDFDKLDDEDGLIAENVRNYLSIQLKISTASVTVKQGGRVTAFKGRFKSNLNTPVENDFWYLLEIWGDRAKIYPQANDINLLKSMERNDFLSYKNQRDMAIDRRRLSRLIGELELSLSKKNSSAR